MNTRNLFLATAFATGCAIAPAHTQTIPIFLDYASKCRWPASCDVKPTGRVDLSDPRAFQFRTRLKEGAKEPPNFDGVYRVVLWGCGTACLSGAVIDERNGHVIWLPSVEYNDVIFSLESSLMMFQHNLTKQTVFMYLDGETFRTAKPVTVNGCSENGGKVACE